MPVFALANSGVYLADSGVAALGGPVALGTAAGLFVGKQLGVFALTMLGVRLGLAPMPGDATALKLFGVASVSGVGFTVALFIAGLAFEHAPALVEEAKLGILLGSAAAGLVGYAILRLAPARRP
jgi:NhaA family Na+:H+ antiporter